RRPVCAPGRAASCYRRPKGGFLMGLKTQSPLRIERLEDRCTPSGGVVPANGREFGTSTLPLVQELRAQGTNLGQAFCSIEQGDCAADSLALLQPPGQR